MKYRQEIDGLRVIALLPVIFFYAGFTAFSGGFVADLCQKASSIYSDIDKRDAHSIPPENYVSLINLSKNPNCIQITNTDGELLASDLKHFTIAGVEYFAPLFFANENVIRILNR